jgi:arabinofuranosyltransferase
MALGFLPLLLWTAFSLFYYGFPFPNTAYAKLATGIPVAGLARQGALYLLNSLRWDPLTLAAIATAILLALVRRRPAELAVAAGIVLQLIYVVRVGGDFMSGRFLTLPLLAAVALLVVIASDWAASVAGDSGGASPAPRRALALAAVVIVALGLVGHLPVWLAGNPTGDAARRDGDIADERAYYTPYTGLWADRVLHPWAEQGLVLRAEGPAVVEHGNVGLPGHLRRAGRPHHRPQRPDRPAAGPPARARPG